jgi:hypothetical protein
MLGYFLTEIEIYYFMDWLEYWVRPRKKEKGKSVEADKAWYFASLLRQANPQDPPNPSLEDPLRCLFAYRQWAKNNDPKKLTTQMEG